MNWILLVMAGLLEVLWARLLPHTEGLTRVGPTAAFVGALGMSMYLLAVASRSIPITTAYAVWVGIGIVGSALVDVIDTRPSPQRMLAVAGLVAAIIAVKATGAEA